MPGFAVLTACAPRPVPPRRRAGFTLLELLIVIFIISLISAGFVKLMVGFGGPAQSLEYETRRLHRLLTLAVQDAILEAGDIGVLIETDAYRFVSRGQAYWVTFDGDDLLRRHRLPQGWRFELWQDGEPVPPAAPPAEKSAAEQKPAQPPPVIVLYGSGEVTPFRLRILPVDTEASSVIEADENGTLQMRFPEPES